MSEPAVVDESRALYVGFGVGTYEDAAFGTLPRAVPDVEDIAAVLAPHGYATCVVADPDEQAVRQGLKAHLAKDVLPQGGSLVVVWAGHGGVVSEQTLQLIARDTEAGADPWVSADRIASVAARTGASQILLVFDTCHAEAGALPALTVVSRVLAACRRARCACGWAWWPRRWSWSRPGTARSARGWCSCSAKVRRTTSCGSGGQRTRRACGATTSSTRC